MRSTHAQADAHPAHETGDAARPRAAGRHLQRRPAEGAHGEAPPAVGQVLGSAGSAIEPSARQQLEARFGHDFGRVRVHADARAAESAEAVEARAYTVGEDIVFGPGQYAPHTQAGRRLLAHELTHTLQQRASRPALQTRLKVSRPSDSAEAEADRVASVVADPLRAGPHEPVRVNAAPGAALMRDAKPGASKKADAPQTLGLGPHEPAEPVPPELLPGLKINKSLRLKRGELIPRVQYFLKLDLVFPRIPSYMKESGTTRISTGEAAAITDPNQRRDLVYNPEEGWDKILADLTRGVAKWQEAWNAKTTDPADQLVVDGGLSKKTLDSMRKDGLVENDAKVWAERDELEWGAVRGEERRFWRKPGEGGDAVRDKIVGLAMSQIGKISQQDRGDHKKFGWQRIMRYYEVAFGAADEERKLGWLSQNFESDLYGPPTEEEEQRIWEPGMEGLGASGHVMQTVGRRPGGERRPYTTTQFSEAAQKEVSEDNPYTTDEAVRKQTTNEHRDKGYEGLKKVQAASFVQNFGRNVHPLARPKSLAGQHEAYRRVQRPDMFAFQGGPWSWCAIFTMWAVKSVTGRGLWAEAPVGLKSTAVGKPADFKGARRGDILAIRSSNNHYVILAKDPSPEPTADELLEAVEGNIEAQAVRQSMRWRVKNVSKYFSAVD